MDWEWEKVFFKLFFISYYQNGAKNHFSPHEDITTITDITTRISFAKIDVYSKTIMPFGGIMAAILVGWKSWPVIEARLTRTDGTRPVWLPLLRGFCRYIAPVLIFVILVQNL